MNSLKFFAAVLFALGPVALTAQLIPLDPLVRTGKLANGFTYYIRHNEEPKNRVVFYLANKVGSLMEDDDQRGLAHFTEHMSFNGTSHFPKNELVDYLQRSGVRFGADINAYTSFDETVYQLPLPSDSPELVRNGVRILRDWAGNALMDDGEIEKERGVVLEEKRLGKGAGDRMSNEYLPALLNQSRYASRLPIGREEILSGFRPELIKRFYKDWYRPDLQAIIVVGDIDVTAMEKLIRSTFADLKNPLKERARIRYTVPLTGKNQFISVTDPEMAYTRMEIISKLRAKPLRSVADYRFEIVRTLFNEMLGARFDELVREANPPYINGGAGLSSFLGGLDAYTVSFTARQGEIERGFKAAWREQERVIRNGFTSTELARAKSNYLARLESMLSEQDKIPSDNYVNEYLQYFLQSAAAPGLPYEYKLVKKQLPGITLKELNDFARRNGKTVDRDILLQAPEKDKALLPTEATVLRWMKEVNAEDLKPYSDENVSSDLLRHQPVSGTILSRTFDAGSATTRLLLSNGINVILKKTDYRNDEIQFAGFSPGGTSLYPDNEFQSASAANIIPDAGAGNYTATQLEKYLAGKQAGVQVYLGERTQSASGGAVRKDLGAALELMYAYMTEPRYDTSYLQGIIARSGDALANRSDDPNAVFSDTVNAILGDHNIRRTGPTLEKLDQVNPTRAFAIFNERFSNAAGFTFVFVGNIDTATLDPLLEKYIASLPVNGKADSARDLHIQIPEGIIERTVYSGKEPKATVNLVYSGAFDYSPENKTGMDGLQEVLQIRLTERLREDESGVYSPSARISTTRLPSNRFSLRISFGCSPENVEKLIASSLDEIEKIKLSGPDPKNVNKFKAEALRASELQLRENGFWLNYLTEQLVTGDPLDEIKNYSRQVNEVTPAMIRSLANQYLTGKNFIRLVLLPAKTN